MDDAVASYAKLALNGHPDETWVNAQYKNAIAADLDGDGFDEIFVVFFASGSNTLKYILIKPGEEGSAVLGVLDPAADATSLDMWAQPSLAAGDLNGDGSQELAVGFGKLYLLSNVGGNNMVIQTKGYLDQNDVNVAIGNTDRDPQDELVVTYTETVAGVVKGYYEIIKGGQLNSPSERGELHMQDAAGQNHFFAEANVAIGDIDGDRIGDIVFHGRRVNPGGDHWHLFAMRYEHSPSPTSSPHYSFRTFLKYTNAWYGSTPRTLVLLDVDGDGTQEIFGWGEIIGLNSNGAAEVRYSGIPNWVRAAGGNVDSDRRDDLLVATNGELRVYGLDGLDNWVLKKQLPGGATALNSPALALGNLDDDSAIVRYDGEYELLFTDPHLVTVMASPPYKLGVEQDISSTTATFGKEVSSSVVESQSLGFSVGFSVGYAWESDLFQSGFSAKSTFEAAFDWHASQSRTITTYHSYTTAPGKDKVVFATIPFDVYYYTIVSSPKPEEVGQVVTVNLPRAPQMLGSSLEFYNANNGGGLDVDERILQQTLGDPWSYMNADDKNLVLSKAESQTPGYQRLWNGPIQVDESGTNRLGLSASQGSAHGASMDFSVSFEWETKAGGATVGGSVGFRYGHSYEISTEEGAFYEGTVGAIPGEHYAENAYCYGLLVYPQALEDQRFVVLNWWTQRQCGEI